MPCFREILNAKCRVRFKKSNQATSDYISRNCGRDARHAIKCKKIRLFLKNNDVKRKPIRGKKEKICSRKGRKA